MKRTWSDEYKKYIHLNKTIVFMGRAFIKLIPQCLNTVYSEQEENIMYEYKALAVLNNSLFMDY